MRTYLEHTLGFTLTLVLLLLVLTLTSCGPDAPVMPDLADSTLPFPATPDQLMLNFQTAYAARDLAGYAATLHPDFSFVETTGGSYGRDVELRIAARMFSGEDKVTPAGRIAGIARIEVVAFHGAGDWTAADGDGDQLQRTYEVHLRFHRNDEGVMVVRGACVVTVRRDGIELGGGVVRDGWRIVRLVDGTG